MSDEKRLQFNKVRMIEFFSLILLLLISYLLRDRPKEVYESLQAPGNKSEVFSLGSSNMTDALERDDLVEEKNKDRALDALKKRNPFSLEGSYLEFPIPDPPYKLVAVRTGKKPEAIIRDYTGALKKVGPKEVLPDGSKVLRIGANFIEFKRLDRIYKIYIYNVEVEKWKPKRPFGS